MRGPRSRGFTLLELMTSVVITIIILLAVAAAFTAVQTVYQREAHLKTAVEAARVSTGFIERVTRFIGYGLDPRFAIDMSTANLPGTTKSNFSGATHVAGQLSTATANPNTLGFITDDFAFRYRDPSYLRRATYDGTNVILQGTPATFNMVLQPGRLLQLVCTGGQTWAVVKTSAATTTAGNSVAAATANVAGNPTSFPDPPSGPAAACLLGTGTSAPYLMLVREVRLRVIPLGTAPNIRPYLVAYNALDLANIGTTATDFDPIAADVESFQVSYVMNKGPGSAVDVAGGDWVLGNDTGDTLNRVPVVTNPRPLYDVSYLDASRFTADPANVRAVVFDLSVRTLAREGRRAFFQPRLADDSTVAQPRPDGFFHVPVSTTVRTPNLTSRTGFTPPLKVAGDPSPLNEWGG